MKTIHVFIKAIKEQTRSFWVLLLSLSMGPFFVLVYYLILQASDPVYKIIFVNNDKGVAKNGQYINHGKELTEWQKIFLTDSLPIPLKIIIAADIEVSKNKLRNKDADALVVIHPTFSEALERHLSQSTKEAGITGPSGSLSGSIRYSMERHETAEIEFIGDLTSTNYLISAVWANEIINQFALVATQSSRMLKIKETPLGISSKISTFDMIVPGILLVSLIMLMFTASIAFVSEVENKTILRLKLSKLSAFEFLGGITLVQLLVGIASVVLTLGTALFLGFHYTGSLFTMLFIATLTSLSLVAFSLIIAAVTRTAAEVLVVGNFPMFLFMFFTGAAFPLKSKALFTIAGYPVNIQGLMTPTHAISAMNKTFVMNMEISAILPELVAIILLTLLYFLIGLLLFKKRHLALYK
jgi:ABC-2 type transport system permease protein